MRSSQMYDVFWPKKSWKNCSGNIYVPSDIYNCQTSATFALSYVAIWLANKLHPVDMHFQEKADNGDWGIVFGLGVFFASFCDRIHIP